MAIHQADGSIRLNDGRIVYANSLILAQDLCEIVQLCIPPPTWPFVSGGGGGGALGPQGSVGPAGSGGGSGVQGNQGFQGTNPGPQGLQGFQGNVGPQGVGLQGPQGNQGLQGFQGTQGFQGNISPVIGGSGTQYPTITAAIAGEVATEVAGNVPQAGTQAGILVGPGTLSAIDNFYKDWFVLNTSAAPSNGLVSQWARVSNYVGATRTFTLDKPWDFSAEATFSVIDPARLTLVEDITEDVIVNKQTVMNVGGNRLKGKIDFTAANFGWIRGAGGYVTNGVQKTDFGLLKIDDCTVSRRDATIYAILMTEGSNLGRCEISNCEFMGRIAGRRGAVGWSIVNCTDLGVPNATADDDVPYALVESVGAVAVALTQLDVAFDSEFGGALIYSENSVTGGAVYLSVVGQIKATNDYQLSPDWTPKKYSIAKAVGAGIVDVTTASGLYTLHANGFLGALTSPTKNIPISTFLTVKNSTANCQLILNTIVIVASFSGQCLFRGFYAEGPSTNTGTYTLGGTSVKNVTLNDANGRTLEWNGPFTGSVTVSGGAWSFLDGTTGGLFDNDVAQAAGAPALTVSVVSDFFGCKNVQFVNGGGTALISVGTFTFSGLTRARQSGLGTLADIESTGTAAWTFSGDFEGASCSTSSSGASTSPLVISARIGSGTTTISGNIYVQGGRYGGFVISSSQAAGTTSIVSSATIRICDISVSASSLALLARGDTATSVATVSGTVIFDNCVFEVAQNLLRSDPGGSSVTGPAALVFEFCAFEAALTERSGAGTFAWTDGATMTFKTCHMEGLFTFVGTSFTTVEAFHTRFNGKSLNKSISATGTRPTTFRYWECSFAARFDDILPEIINVYDVLPAQAALVQGQPVKINTTNQYQVCVAASIVDGVLLAAASAGGTFAVAVRQGRVFVAVNAGVANGDNLVLDTVTPTQANTGVVAVVGQEIGTALEAAGTTIAGKAYTAVNVR